MSNKISLNIFWYSKNFFELILSVIDFRILPLEKLTLANLAEEVCTFLLLNLKCANFCSIKNLVTPKMLDG